MGGFCLGHHPHPQPSIIPSPSHSRGGAFAGAPDRYLLLSPPSGFLQPGRGRKPPAGRSGCDTVASKLLGHLRGERGAYHGRPCFWTQRLMCPPLQPLGMGTALSETPIGQFGVTRCVAAASSVSPPHFAAQGGREWEMATGPCVTFTRAVIRWQPWRGSWKVVIQRGIEPPTLERLVSLSRAVTGSAEGSLRSIACARN